MGLSSLLYDAMSSELALFIPATYCRLMLGDERLSLRLSLAAAFGLLVLWLFSWRTGHGDWAAFSVVMVALVASLLRPQHASAVAQLFARPTRFLLVGAAVGVIAAVGKPLAYHLFPISELALAYSTAELFAGAALEPAAARLALISITSQLPLGVVTTNNLRAAQQRKNALLTVGTEGGTAATKFTRLVAGFIAFTAVPFFFQRSVVESINAHAMFHFVDTVENSMRLHAVLRSGATLAAAATDETIDSHATHLRQVLTTSYRLLERKLFTLPRLALLPGALVGHPVASAAGMAIAVVFDGAKAKAVALITSRIENLNRESRKLSSKRSRVEAHDSQHAGLLRGARAEAFTRAHWQALTIELQDLTKRTRALEGVRMWIRWLFWQDVVLPGVECWVAFLLEAGHVHVAEVMVYTRAFDDAIDAVLMRSKAEAELERLKSDAARLAALHTALTASSARPAGSVALKVLLAESSIRPSSAVIAGSDAATHISTGGHGRALRLQGVGFSRGAASVAMDALELPVPGIYAVVGPNGVGKSSLFALLGACQEALASRDEISRAIGADAHEVRERSASIYEMIEEGMAMVSATAARKKSRKEQLRRENEQIRRARSKVQAAISKWDALGFGHGDGTSLLEGDGTVVAEAVTALPAAPPSEKAFEETGAVVTVLPAGLQLTGDGGTVTLPPGEGGKQPSIVEVGQRAYTPLHVRPIDWLMNSHPNGNTAAAGQRGTDTAARVAAARVAALAVELRLGLGERSGDESSEESDAGYTAGGKGHGEVAEMTPSDVRGEADDDPFVASLLREHEDWGGSMSGGQRVKLELIRSVFLPGACPDVLLLDEAFAPLDPSSKLLIMRRLRRLCSTSLVLVIYHANTGEVGTDQAEASALGSADALAGVCSEAGGSFFDGVMQFSDDGDATFDPVAGRCT